MDSLRPSFDELMAQADREAEERERAASRLDPAAVVPCQRATATR